MQQRGGGVTGRPALPGSGHTGLLLFHQPTCRSRAGLSFLDASDNDFEAVPPALCSATALTELHLHASRSSWAQDNRPAMRLDGLERLVGALRRRLQVLGVLNSRAPLKAAQVKKLQKLNPTLDVRYKHFAPH